MSISKDLFLAILSMDSYNRGYGAGIEGLGSERNVSKIGNATVTYTLKNVSEAFAAKAQAAGFYAISYKVEDGSKIAGLNTGDTIISYRGTDNPSVFADEECRI